MPPTMTDQDKIEEYWNQVLKRMEFFTACNVDFLFKEKPSKKERMLVKDFHNLPHIRSDIDTLFDRAADCYADYEMLARYWLDSILIDHVAKIWNITYSGIIEAGSDADTAITVAENVTDAYVKDLKKKYT